MQTVSALVAGSFLLVVAGCSDAPSAAGAGGDAAGGGVGVGTPAMPGTPGPSGTGTGETADGGVSKPSADAGPTDAGPVDAAAEDPCPNLPIPTTSFNRNVMYREWSETAVGDGVYFAGQAPGRLGFNRVQHRLWLAKFRVEANTYLGRISAYGDSTGGIAWISDSPSDPSFAVQHHTLVYGTHGGGSIGFVVVENDAAATAIATNPAYALYKSMPQLRGDHCYYAGFENVETYPTTAIDTSFWSSADNCGASSGGVCYYLAFDFSHFLHQPLTGNVMGGNVIAGLTH
jgi:hypothetical protein